MIAALDGLTTDLAFAERHLPVRAAVFQCKIAPSVGRTSAMGVPAYRVPMVLPGLSSFDHATGYQKSGLERTRRRSVPVVLCPAPKEGVSSGVSL